MLFQSYFSVLVLVLGFLDTQVAASPRRKKNSSTTNGGVSQATTAQQQAAQIPGGVSTATDGSTILDQTVTVK